MQYYNIWFDICAFLIYASLILMYINRRSIRIPQNNIFFCMILLAGTATFFDVLAVTMDGGNRIMVLLFNTFVHSCDIAGAFLFTLYVTAFINYHVQRMKAYRILTIPAALAELILIINLFTGVVFYVDDFGFYHRGPLAPMAGLMQIAYLLTGMILLYRLRMQLTREKLSLMIPFVVLLILSLFLQYFMPSMLLQHFGGALLAITMYLGLQNPDELYDKESDMMNLDAFNTQIERRLGIGMTCQIVAVGLQSIDLILNMIGENGVEELKKETYGFIKQYEDDAMAFRLSTGVFAIVPDSESPDRAEEILQEVVNRFRMPFLKELYELEVGAVCCHIEVPRDAANIDEVRNVIRLALDTGFKNGIDVVDMSDLDLRHEAYVREVDEKVRNAVQDGKLEVYYQPIYSTKERKFVAAEALLRMHDDDHGFISPAVFIPLAEINGSVVEIDRFVFDSVCKTLSGNPTGEMGLHYIELNLSPTDCIQEDLPDYVEKKMKETGVQPDRINLEITETANEELTSMVDENVMKLHKKGLSFSLDDFGTGYSSLSRILELPLSIIKIDKSIVQPAFDTSLSEKDRDAAYTLLSSYVDMIKRIGCSIVTEGVETKEQAAEIIRLGCDYIQGFYFSKPLPEKLFLNKLQEQTDDPDSVKYPEVYELLE